MDTKFTQPRNDKRSRKQIITEAVLAQLPSINDPIEKTISEWWFTKSGEGLRLTPIGDFAFRTAEIEFFDLPLSVKHESWYSFVSNCGKKLKCPYYIGVNKNDTKLANPFIRLYDSKIAMLVELYGGIQEYLESVKVRR